MIYEIGGKQVMLDFDLADLYECKNGTKEINQAVKNNLDKFPKSYSWILSDEELSILRSKVLTFEQLSKINNRKYKIRVFTESGTWMLSTILKTEIASRITRKIIDAFVMMRRYIDTTMLEQRSINEQVINNNQSIIENTKEINQNRRDIELYKNELDKQEERLHKSEEDIELLKSEFFKFDTKRNDNLLFLDGQIYDAYSKIIDIMREAKSELIIVDGYSDKKVLDMISNLNVKVILIVKEKANLKDRDIEEYNKQYSNLSVIRDNSSHDRYFIIDRKTFYHSGASINHAGKGIFSITRMADEAVCEFLLKKIETIISEQIKSSEII